MKKIAKIVLILLLAVGVTASFAQQPAESGPSEPNKKLYNFTIVDTSVLDLLCDLSHFIVKGEV